MIKNEVTNYEFHYIYGINFLMIKNEVANYEIY